MIFLIFTLFFLIGNLNSLCISDNSSFVNTIPILPSLSPSNEIIDGFNYGNLYAYTGGLWMLKQFNISKSVSKITSLCPKGWLPPTLEDLNGLINFSKSNISVLTDPEIFNMNISLTYASNTKTFPNETDSYNANASMFYGIKFYNKSSAYVGQFNSYLNTVNTKVFCVHFSKSINNNLISQSSLIINGLSTKDLIKGIKYTFSVNNTNLVAYQWNINNQLNTSKELNVIPMKYGEFQIKVKGTLFDGTTIGSCSSTWVRNYTGSEANTNISISDIKQVKFSDKKVYRSTSLHFTSGSAALAPIDEGGAYILYASTTASITNNLYVKTIDNDGNQMNEIDLAKGGYPFDIVAIHCGFVALIKNYTAADTLYLLGMNTCTNQTIFERNLMNNGDNPTTFNSEQLIFYKDAAGAALFGMEAMFNPSNGRLVLARDRVVALFAHYNYFGSSGSHTADTMATFNMSGLDEKLAFSWGSSHSLVQSLAYNGQNAFSASLGEAYPLNIRFTVSEVSISNSQADPKTGLYNRLDSSANDSLLEGIIPGDGTGFSCGRLGTISVFDDGAFNVVSYARRKCTTTFNGVSKTSDIDVMGLAFFDIFLNRTGDINLGSGTYVNQVQSAKYGNNIFLLYVTSNRTASSGQMLAASIAKTDNMTVMLLSLNGTIISGPFNFNESFLPPSDVVRVMNDGRVAWTFIDTNNSLNYYYLPKPEQTLTNIDLVKSSGFYKNNEDFYFINSSDPNIYKASISGSIFNMTNGIINVTNGTNGTNGTNETKNGNFINKLDINFRIYSSLILLIILGFLIN